MYVFSKNYTISRSEGGRSVALYKLRLYMYQIASRSQQPRSWKRCWGTPSWWIWVSFFWDRVTSTTGRVRGGSYQLPTKPPTVRYIHYTLFYCFVSTYFLRFKSSCFVLKICPKAQKREQITDPLP